MKYHEINYCYWPTIFSIFDWTFNLNEDFIKGKHMAFRTNSSAGLLGVIKHNLQSTVCWNEGDMIAKHFSLWKVSYAAVDMLVWVVQIKSSTWH